MKTLLKTALLGILLAACCPAQTIIPQIADGGNWRTAIMLVNTTTSDGTVSLNFYEDLPGQATTTGGTQPWNPPFTETGNTQNLAVPAGGTMFLHTPGTAAALSQGWCKVTGPAGIVVYAIYTYEAFNGRPDQDGTSLAVSAGTRILVPFDNTPGPANTPGFVTSMAIVNPTATAESVSVNIQTDAGLISTASIASLPANGQLAFLTGTQFPATQGHRGLLEFYTSGSIAISSFHFNPTIALTSSPAIVVTGTPIIGGKDSPGPAFEQIYALGTWSPVGVTPGAMSIRVIPNADGSFVINVRAYGGSSAPVFAVLQGTASNQGQTFTSNKIMFPLDATVTSASLTFTLSQTSRVGLIGAGSFSGTLSVKLIDSLGGALLSGAFTGMYSQTFLQ